MQSGGGSFAKGMKKQPRTSGTQSTVPPVFTLLAKPYRLALETRIKEHA